MQVSFKSVDANSIGLVFPFSVTVIAWAAFHHRVWLLAQDLDIEMLNAYANTGNETAKQVHPGRDSTIRLPL